MQAMKQLEAVKIRVAGDFRYAGTMTKQGMKI